MKVVKKKWKVMMGEERESSNVVYRREVILMIWRKEVLCICNMKERYERKYINYY